MNSHLAIVIAIIGVAVIFDYINGFHDAANSVATIVSTRVLTPRVAVAWAAFFNFVAFAVFPLHVANAIGKEIVDPAMVDNALIVGALSGAIVWNLLTWWWGLPSSSSHALVGGLIGAAIAKGGFGVLYYGLPRLTQTAVFIVVSPMLGMLTAGALMVGVAWLFRRATPGKVDHWFRRLQLVSAAAFSISHGGNDAQKTMGIITVLLYSNGYLGGNFHVPLWVAFMCYAAMGLGTLSGGWRIVRTMGMRLTELKPFGGFCAETGGSAAIFLATGLGIPVSTTHTITGGIVGVGLVNKPGGVRWGVALRILWAWLFTIQASALIGAISYLLLHLAGM